MGRQMRRVRDVGLRRLAIGFVVLAAVIAASVTGYIASRHSTNQESYFGDWENPNRIEVTVWITRVDSATQALSVTIVNIHPAGSLADAEGNFAQDSTVTTAAIGTWRAQIKA